MARLFVVVGYPDTNPTAQPFPVYVGTNGDEKRAAIAASSAARFLILDNPLGIRKNNAPRPVPATALPEAATSDPALVPSPRRRK
jgi:hypothetical protein